LNDQVGDTNTGVNQSTQDASIDKDTVNVRPERRVPRH